MTELDTIRGTDFVGRRNGTFRGDDDKGDLRLDSKPPSRSRTTLRNEEAGEYQKSVVRFVFGHQPRTEARTLVGVTCGTLGAN